MPRRDCGCIEGQGMFYPCKWHGTGDHVSAPEIDINPEPSGKAGPSPYQIIELEREVKRLGAQKKYLEGVVESMMNEVSCGSMGRTLEIGRKGLMAVGSIEG